MLKDVDIHQKYYREIFRVLEDEPYAKFLGLKLVDLGEGTAVAEIQVKEHMLNSHKTVHGAIIFSLADYVFAAASNSYGKTAVGLSTNVNFIAPGFLGDVLRATAVEEKRNNKVGFYRISVESRGELLATMDAIVYRKQQYYIEVAEADQN